MIALVIWTLEILIKNISTFERNIPVILLHVYMGRIPILPFCPFLVPLSQCTERTYDMTYWLSLQALALIICMELNKEAGVRKAQCFCNLQKH